MRENFLANSTTLTDEELVSLARHSGSDAFAALILRYQSTAKTLVKGYHVAGLEPDDLVQEAFTGLFKAVRSFHCGCDVPFRAYALLCMRRQVQTAIKAGLAGKQSPLSDYIPLENTPELSGYAGNPSTTSPESILIMEEEAAGRKQIIESLLSEFEQRALKLRLNGLSYEEISREMKTTSKSVDNALQRVRRKLRSMKP